MSRPLIVFLEGVGGITMLYGIAGLLNGLDGGGALAIGSIMFFSGMIGYRKRSKG
jgi:hypothetical protein